LVWSTGELAMPYGFLDIAMTPSVKAAQAANGSAEMWTDFEGERSFDRLSESEAAFIAARDSFYMATVSESGWPYVQHRGGPPGFLRMLDEKTLACADFRGNRQYISIGNLAANDRACLFLIDYPHRQRLKIFAHVETRRPADDADLMTKLAMPGYRGKVERALVFHLEAFDWNCPQHITPRFSEREIANVLASARERSAALEAENKELRRLLDESASNGERSKG
jgi:predicted pyridoxine 5'-phosphate oxidase superfamily flavin-nucleotide-binding protein